MGIPLSVLIVEDSEDDMLLIVRELRRGGYDPVFKRVETPGAMVGALSAQTWDVVISDYKMPQFSGLHALKLMQEKGLDLPFILVSGTIGEETAVEAMRAGAHDYIMKGHLKRLLPAIERELKEASERKRRRQAEQALQQSEEKFRKLAETTATAIFLYRGTRLLYVNPVSALLTGYTTEEMLSMDFLNLVHPDFRELIKERASARLGGGEVPSRYEVKILTKSGEERWLELTAGVVEIKGKPTGIGTASDITDRMRTEEALKEREAELKRRVDELEEFYNMAVGRELRMVKLKEEIENLKEELAKFNGKNLKNI